MWAYAIIFCGHFPDQTYTFSQEEVKDETRGGFYVRQLLGAANIEGSPLFHVASGNLGYQVEHHLYPDMPSTRYAEIAPRVKAICERYELPYNTGPFLQAARRRAAHDPAPRLPRRHAAAQARPVPRRRRHGQTRRPQAATILVGHRGVGAQARDRLADDARDLHLRDADPLADLGLREVLGEAQAQDLALARRDDPHDVLDGGAVLGQGEARAPRRR